MYVNVFTALSVLLCFLRLSRLPLSSLSAPPLHLPFSYIFLSLSSPSPPPSPLLSLVNNVQGAIDLLNRLNEALTVKAPVPKIVTLVDAIGNAGPTCIDAAQ